MNKMKIQKRINKERKREIAKIIEEKKIKKQGKNRKERIAINNSEGEQEQLGRCMG